LKRDILWAPWRIGYIKNLSDKPGCFLCDYLTSPDDDKENLVLWRTPLCMVVFNRYPYNNGHLLIAPNRHIADFNEANPDELLEMTLLIRESQNALTAAISPHGFNVGANFGRCAGAGLPGHMHIHVVPRWNGDTNYMHVVGDTDVISQSLTELYDQLIQISTQQNLPKL
jgi:ATP adenylyltransferase